MAGFDAYLHLLRLVSLPGLRLRLALTSESSLLDLMLTLFASTPSVTHLRISVQMNVKKT